MENQMETPTGVRSAHLEFAYPLRDCLCPGSDSGDWPEVLQQRQQQQQQQQCEMQHENEQSVITANQ
jgi:hypothetical protein